MRTTSFAGRARNPLTKEKLEELFHQLWGSEAISLPRYPEVIGGVSVYYSDAEGVSHDVQSFDELLSVYGEELTATVSILGSVEGRARVDFEYHCSHATAKMTTHSTPEQSTGHLEIEFRKKFPLPIFTKLDVYLKELGYNVKTPDSNHHLARYRDYYSKNSRLKEKAAQGSQYPHFFEQLIQEMIRSDFGWVTGLNYKIQNEGPGGDYDVLALNSARELLYIECKSGGTIPKTDIENFYKRHRFLKPALSIVVFDETKSVAKSRLSLMREILTENSRKKDPNLPDSYQYPDFSIIPEGDQEFAYHINRNIYFCSGENIRRAISHCLRHYDGIVSWWS